MAERKTYTPAGYQALLDERAKAYEQKELNKKEISTARAYGDLSENSEYTEAKNFQEQIDARIAELEELVKNAVVLDESEIDHSKVNVGSLVVVKNEANGSETTYQIVGTFEADPFAPGPKRISDVSPIGAALMGHEVGYTATLVRPDKSQLRLTILSITRA